MTDYNEIVTRDKQRDEPQFALVIECRLLLYKQPVSDEFIKGLGVEIASIKK